MRWLPLVLFIAAAAPAMAASTLDHVRKAGALACGVVSTPEDWGKQDLHGPLMPLSLEICKAVAVASLGMQAKVQAHVYETERQAEAGVARHEVDLTVGVTPDATAGWQFKIGFGPPIFYDGQGFLVRSDENVTSVAGLAGLKVCVIDGTENEKILLARTVAKGIGILPLPFQEEGEMDDGLAVRHCDAISAYVSRLAATKSEYPKQLGQDRVLPQMLTLDPVAVAYRPDDLQWQRIVDWTIYALIQAEASGVTQANVARMRDSQDPVIQRLLGIDWATSRALGLTAKDWAAQVIAVVGNYGEIYDRTVGAHAPLNLPRGPNALWTDGGLMHPLPLR
jgi:general L-amino acid transport system substrate-binding protein